VYRSKAAAAEEAEAEEEEEEERRASGRRAGVLAAGGCSAANGGAATRMAALGRAPPGGGAVQALRARTGARDLGEAAFSAKAAPPVSFASWPRHDAGIKHFLECVNAASITRRAGVWRHHRATSAPRRRDK
jgi:hypothetical protein